MKRVQVLPCLFICLSMMIFSVCRVSAVSTTVAVDPSLTLANVGDTFSVNVTVTNIVNFTSWQLNLYYLNTILNCTGAVEGPFLQTGGGTYFVPTIKNNYNSTHGNLLAYSTLLGMTSVNGSGVILTVTFKAIGGGNTALTLANTKLGDEKIPPQPITHVDVNGAVTVTGAGHDIAVTNLASIKTVMGQGYPGNISVTILNQGGYTETFNTTVHANQTIVAPLVSLTLISGDLKTLTFIWNTTSFAKGNYTMSAYAGPVTGDVNATNNTFNDGIVTVTIPGDVNGDFKVNLVDLVLLANAYGSRPGDIKWNANTDIDGTGVVGLSDLVILAIHYGQHFP